MYICGIIIIYAVEIRRNGYFHSIVLLHNFNIQPNHSMRKLLLTLTALLLSICDVYSVPAYRELIDYRQPDGKVLRIRLSGDEHSHQVLTEDGYLLLKNENNNGYSYADLNSKGMVINSGILAVNIEERNRGVQKRLKQIDKDLVYKTRCREISQINKVHKASKSGVGLFPDASYPITGTPKALVILVEYADVKFTLEEPASYFTGLLNQEGFSEYGATGSVSEWFATNSDGKFCPEFDVLGPVTLSGNRSYYGGNNARGNDSAPQKMAIEACRMLDDKVEFSQYDTDGDGFIDNVFIFYAGTGENRTGETDAVWPHTSWVTQLEMIPYTFDGVTLDRYACTNEWVDRHPDGIGTFCHEFSHVMGLPDLYHTLYGSMPYTPGEWSVMDYGPYLNEGRTPPLYSSFERYALGWLTPEELTDNKSYALSPLSANKAYSVSKEGSDELFLFENRQPEGWDKYLPGHGMLIWHVDYNADVWNKRAVNNDESYQRVDLVEADNLKSQLSRPGDVFPGTQDITDFGPNTTPPFIFHDKTNPGISISAIKERPGGEVTFRAGEGDETPGNVAKVEIENISSNSITIGWTSVEGVENYIVEMRCKSDNVKTSYEVKKATCFEKAGLNPETSYMFSVTAYDGKEESPEAATVEATTLSPEIDYYTLEMEGISDIKEDGFRLNWTPLSLATAYMINMEKVERGEAYTTAVDFTDGLDALPTGWSTTSRLTYANKAYSGESPLSLRLSNADDYITSGNLEAPVYSLSFWMRGSSTGSDDRVAVEILKDEEWVEYESYHVTTTSGGETINVDLSTENCQGIRLVFKKQSEKGSLAIDDITLIWGGDRKLVSLADWNWKEIEADNYYDVTGLDSDSEYAVSVKGTDGTLFSKASEKLFVRTMKSSGINVVETTGGEIKRYNLQGVPVKGDSSREVVIEIKPDGRREKRIISHN